MTKRTDGSIKFGAQEWMIAASLLIAVVGGIGTVLLRVNAVSIDMSTRTTRIETKVEMMQKQLDRIEGRRP